MAGDYNTIVGSNKSQFLAECSLKIAPARCIDVQSGSILITILGTDESELDQVETSLESDGLDLPSFPALSIGTARNFSKHCETKPFRMEIGCKIQPKMSFQT